jgi:hypothetical protein
MARSKQLAAEDEIPKWPHVQARISPEQYTKLRVYLYKKGKTVREFFGEWLETFLKKVEKEEQ